MCPNCILNQAGLQPGLYVAFGVCAVFFVVAVAAMWWAFRNGEFDDIESSKFDMMDDDPDSVIARNARAAVARVREKKKVTEQVNG